MSLISSARSISCARISICWKRPREPRRRGGQLMAINWLAVIAAATSSFVLGGVWYAALFAKAHQRAAGLSDAQVASGNKGLIFGGSFLLALIASASFAVFLGSNVDAMT